MFNRLDRAVRTLAGFLFFNGGILAVPRKVLRMYRKEGVAGFKRLFSAAYSGHAVSRPGPNRPRDKDDFALEVPFRYDLDAPFRCKVCAVIHIFYPELTAEILQYLANVPCRLDLFISTTSEEKKADILSHVAGYDNGRVEIRVFPNRGRDIAPKLVGFSDVYERYDFALSLHTKKSPHAAEMLAPWREYLYGHLLGSPAIVRSIFALLQYDSVGMVFPQHFFPLRNHLKWGPNFKAAEAILNRMGVDLPHDVLLECPSGSMFWCRTSALRPLLSLELQFEDFDEEHGQIDGTLAHAIERVFLYTLEAYGFTWAKVARRDLYPLPQTIIPVQSTFDIKSGMALVHRVLLGKSRIEGSV